MVSSPAGVAEAGSARVSSNAAPALLAPATAVVILAFSLLLLMTPIWMHFALAASGATAAPLTPELAYQLSDRTVAELFLGPGTFADFGLDESAHMRDVRLVLFVFLGVAAMSLVFVAWSIRRAPDNPRTWRAIARGGSGLVAGLILVGAIAAVAFGAAFELFHRILFPGGNWAFPESSVLILLYPIAFWQLSAAALAVFAIGGGVLVWALARRRARALERRSAE